MKLLLTNETGFRLPKAWAAALLAVLGEAARGEGGVPADCELSLTLVDNAEIHRLNREFRQVDRPTDVLSFPQYGAGEPIMPASSLGDVVISLPKMAEQAAAFGHSQRRELCFLFVHGLLHLLGYDHELSPAEERRHFGRQEEILAKLGINRE